ncbi:MAG: GAF domain-containing protein, partial [Chloroflexi bacterium]
KYDEGMIGETAATEQLIYTNRYRDWPNPDSLFTQFHFETVVAIPLQEKIEGAMSAILMIADTEKRHHVTDLELSILDRFAAQAAVTLHTANLIDSEKRALDHLSLLHRISNYVQTTDNLENVLHVFLTGITAGYGLGFNCAAIMLTDASQKWLVGESGIGHLNPQNAEKAWSESHATGLYQFDAYRNELEGGKFASSPTPIGERIRQVSIPLETDRINPFVTVIEKRSCVVLEPVEFYQLPSIFFEAYQPHTPVVIAPLIVRDRTIGILVADNRFTRMPITRASLELIMTFASSAAIAIDKTRLLFEIKMARNRLQAFYAASQSLVSTDEPAVVLQKIAEKAQTAAQALWVNLILIDVPGQLQRMVHSYQEGFVPPDLEIRKHGLSMTIIQTGEEIVISELSDTEWPVHPDTIKQAIKAVAGFPLAIRGRRIGVMWIHYDIPHHFSFAELEALKLFVNQAAIAYDNALHLRSLDRMRQASQELAGATSLDTVLNKITSNALRVLDADSAAVWSFDEERGKFLLQAWTGDESSNWIWEQFHHEAPSPGGMAYHIMTEGWLGIDSVADSTQHPFLSTQTRAKLKDIGVASFQGVALQVGSEKLGVLYINYQLPQTFTTDVQKAARTFAVHSALALKKVKLLDGYRRTRDIAQVVASMTALESLDATLNEVLSGTQTALNCDAITLYFYDAQMEMVKPYPFMLGVNDRPAAMQLPHIPAHSIIYQILEKREMYIVEDINHDDLFRNSRFTIDEGIATCVALPLWINQEPVGALFVNYRTLHRFTSDELDNIRLFGNQAAVAIHNAQLYQREQSRHRALIALYETSQTVAVSLDLDEILTIIIQQAWYLVRYHEKQASYGSVWLVQDKTQARLVATYPAESFHETKSRISEYIDLQAGMDGRIGLIGRAIQAREAVLVADVRNNNDYLETRSSTRSALVVPILEGDQIVGAINLEHEAVDAFKSENIEAIESLATQAAIAIRNGRLFEQTIKHARLLDAAAQVASHAITILDEDKLLRETVELITSQLDFYHAAVFLLEQNSTIAQLRAASSPGGKIMLQNNFSLSIGEGIVGKVARRGTPYLSADISQDEYHLKNPLLPQTRAEKAFPLIARGEVIGVLDVQSQESITLQPEEVSALQTMANQLANAIQNARLYAKVNRRAVALQALQEAGKAISGSLELNNVLNNIVERAWRLTGTYGPTAQFSCLTLVKEFGTKLEFVAAYPRVTLANLQELIGDIDITVAKRGIMGRAVCERQPQLVSNVTEDETYISFDDNIRAELAIPITLNDKVIGVINVEHPEVDAFDKEDVQNLSTLAAHAAVAIDKANNFRKLQGTYEELQRTHRMMEARTAVACMGMASSIWGHDISNHAQVIKDQLILLKSDLQEFGLSPEAYQYRLDMISRSADKIRQKPLTPPLRSEETMTAVTVNDLVGERVRQLWQNSPYREIGLNLELKLTNTDTVLASAEWLRRVLDILLDNAVDAMQNRPEKTATIHTQLNKGLVEIAVIDTGSGLPPEIHEKIGIEHIERAEDAKGLGMGLLMAQIIVQAYDGQLKVGHTGPQGTSILILLPLHKEKR